MNKETQDQIASVMLLHGTPDQQREALRYCCVNPRVVNGEVSEAPMPITVFQIKQQVCTVNKCWLEVIATSQFERTARMDYEGLVKEYPEKYFELVKVTTIEECLDFTPNKGA